MIRSSGAEPAQSPAGGRRAWFKGGALSAAAAVAIAASAVLIPNSHALDSIENSDSSIGTYTSNTPVGTIEEMEPNSGVTFTLKNPSGEDVEGTTLAKPGKLSDGTTMMCVDPETPTNVGTSYVTGDDQTSWTANGHSYELDQPTAWAFADLYGSYFKKSPDNNLWTTAGLEIPTNIFGNASTATELTQATRAGFQLAIWALNNGVSIENSEVTIGEGLITEAVNKKWGEKAKELATQLLKTAKDKAEADYTTFEKIAEIEDIATAGIEQTGVLVDNNSSNERSIPFDVWGKSDNDVVTVTAELPDGVTIQTEDGTVVPSGSTVPDSSRLKLVIPANTPAGTVNVTVTSSYTGPVKAGTMLRSADGEHQRLITGSTSVTAKSEARAAIDLNWNGDEAPASSSSSSTTPSEDVSTTPETSSEESSTPSSEESSTSESSSPEESTASSTTSATEETTEPSDSESTSPTESAPVEVSTTTSESSSSESSESSSSESSSESSSPESSEPAESETTTPSASVPDKPIATMPDQSADLGQLRTVVTANGVQASDLGPAEVTIAGQSASVSVTDTVMYAGLEPGCWKFTGQLQHVDANGNATPVSDEVSEIDCIESANGTVEVDFGKVELKAGEKYVVFEKATPVLDESGTTVDENRNVPAPHENVNDNAQTVTVEGSTVTTTESTTPEQPTGVVPDQPSTPAKLRTVLTAGNASGSELAEGELTIDGQSASVPVSDTIHFAGLKPGCWKFTGQLQEVSKDGKATPVGKEASTVTCPDSANGTAVVDFGDVEVKADKKYVAFEKATPVTDESGKTVDENREAPAPHEDVTDKAQTVIVKGSEKPGTPSSATSTPEQPTEVTVPDKPETPAEHNPELRTVVTANGQSSENGAAEVALDSDSASIPVTDTVIYSGLEPGCWKFTGQLQHVDKDGNATPVSDAVSVISCIEQADGTVLVEFGNVEVQAGEKYVAFEEATPVTDESGTTVDEGRKAPAPHRDVNDQAQTFVVSGPGHDAPAPESPNADQPGQNNGGNTPNNGGSQNSGSDQGSNGNNAQGVHRGGNLAKTGVNNALIAVLGLAMVAAAGSVLLARKRNA